MGRLPRRWLGIGIAVLVVGALALYTSGSGSTKPAAQSSGSLFAPVEGQPAPTQTIETVPGMSASDLIGLIVKLGIVAAILGGSLWLLRRYAGTANRAAGRTGAIAVADTIVLAQGRALYLVDVGDRALVLGATPQQLSCLAELSDPTVLEKLRTAPERPAAPFAGLSERLAAAMAPRRAEAAALAATRAPHTHANTTGDEEIPALRPARRATTRADFAQTLAAQQASSYLDGDDDDLPMRAPRRNSPAPTRADVEQDPTGDQRRAAMMARIRAMREPTAP